MSPASAFAALHHGSAPFVLPNAWDVASAVLLADAGFPAVGTTSLGITAAAGLPDGAGHGRDLTTALARELVERLSVPLTVDLEGGYHDDPVRVADVVGELAGLGVAGVNLEDGRRDGSLRAPAEHAAVVRAAVAAAPGLFVNARTDTYWLAVGPEEERLAQTRRRLVAYAEAGAAGVFVPGLVEPAEVAALVADVPVPLNVLWRPGADLGALASAGARRISTGSALYRYAMAAMLAAASAARGGEPPPLRPVGYGDLQAMLTRAD